MLVFLLLRLATRPRRWTDFDDKYVRVFVRFICLRHFTYNSTHTVGWTGQQGQGTKCHNTL